MYIHLLQEITLTEIGTEAQVRIVPGTYELEPVPNPIDPEEDSWLVIAGTKHGASEGWWRYSAPGDIF